MQTWAFQENDYRGRINPSSLRRRSFYRYSLWRVRTGEHLFDGAAGDVSEALDTMRAHIRYLSADGKQTAASLAGEPVCS